MVPHGPSGETCRDQLGQANGRRERHCVDSACAVEAAEQLFTGPAIRSVRQRGDHDLVAPPGPGRGAGDWTAKPAPRFSATRSKTASRRMSGFGTRRAGSCRWPCPVTTASPTSTSAWTGATSSPPMAPPPGRGPRPRRAGRNRRVPADPLAHRGRVRQLPLRDVPVPTGGPIGRTSGDNRYQASPHRQRVPAAPPSADRSAQLAGDDDRVEEAQHDAAEVVGTVEHGQCAVPSSS